MVIRFIERCPSTTWEAISLSDASSSIIWAWFRPPAAPNGLFVQVPDETLRAAIAQRQPLTLRSLAFALGVDPASVAYWSLYGVAADGQRGASPGWDTPIPEPGATTDRNIGMFLDPTIVESAAAASITAGSAETLAAPTDIFSRMEAEWIASVQLEIQLAAAAQQLKGALARLNSLNRDLTFDEARYADTKDKHDWHDARRWLRDVSDRVSRFLKDHHTGITSEAGRRSSYEFLYEQYVVPRLPFPGIEQAEREFATHRKTLQTLLTNMAAASTAAVQDGERRAQMILTRIGAKVRSSRSRR